MNVHQRQFADNIAVREQVPLLVGLTGPSGGGKTLSALRLATGIQTVSGGEIFYIDTESRRALHYADRFKFRHVPFSEPFGSLDYLAAIRYCVGKGAGVICIDSMSHEHEGVGGLLDLHDKELDRIAGSEFSKRAAMNMLAWQKPKLNRRMLINGLLQVNANFIFCFRAKETAKPIKRDGKIEVVAQGFMPIAGDEFVFEMTTNVLLLPNAKGVPTWRSDNMGERMMMKLPGQFENIFREQQPLSEEIGRQLAEWAKGGIPTTAPRAATGVSLEAGRSAAKLGMEALKAWWGTLSADDRRLLRSELDDELKPAAERADATGTDFDDSGDRAFSDQSSQQEHSSPAADQPAPDTSRSPAGIQADAGAGNGPATQSGFVPTTAAQYGAYANAWIGKLTDAAEGEKRWKDEKTLRNRANVDEDTRDEVKKALDAKIGELRGGKKG